MDPGYSPGVIKKTLSRNLAHTMNHQNKTIGIFGLGYVGLPLAIEFGKHRPALGIDINQTRIIELKAKEAMFPAQRIL